MKKSIFKLTALFLLLLSSSIYAQDDPGLDPDVPAAPIDDNLWIAGLVGFFCIFVIKRLRTIQSEK